jgi:hypothetical protein
MTLVVAHAGHWLANLLYLAPVLVIVGALTFQSWRDKRSGADKQDEHARIGCPDRVVRRGRTMTVRQLHQLLRGLDDSREVVVQHPAENRLLLHAVWRSAQDDADDAYHAWCERGGPEAFIAYRAAADRADAALDALAADAPGAG